MVIHSRKVRQLLAGAGALAVATIGLAGTAFAAPSPLGPGQEDAPESGTLTIHKHAGSAVEDGVNDGTEQSIDRPGLAGVEFTVQQIGQLVDGSCVAIDLTTPAGWEAVKTITADDSSACDIGTARTVVTGDDGSIPVTGLDLTLYHVEETDAPATVEEKAAPFYVTVPYPTQDADGKPLFVYDVHVYPKNTLTDTPTDKTVTDPGVPGLGANLTWTITTRPLGSFNDGKPLATYTITDKLDSRLTYVADSAVVSMIALDGTATPVDESRYTLEAPTGPGGTLKLTFNDVEWVNSLPAGTKFTFSYDTTVTSVGEGGAINNSAIENEGADDGSTSETPGESTTLWGDVKLLKHSHNDEVQALKGAVFTVHEAVRNGEEAPTCEGTLGDPISVTSEGVAASEFTSGDDGVVTIPGLWVSNDENTTERVYCVVEKTPPAGFSALEEPLQVTVKAGLSGDTYDLKVPNVQRGGEDGVPELPLTGAGGTLAMTIGGLLLIVIGVAATVIARKHRSSQVSE